MRELIVAVNGSVRSLAACQWVADRAAQCGWRVHAVTIFEPYIEWVPANDPRSIWQELEGELAGPWTAALSRGRIPFTHEVIEGLDHIATLTRVARERHADAIVVGAEGHTERRHHRRGNTGIHLVHHSHLPVILVPTQPGEHHDANK
jgi:nucleotide-binding universal stress UspA family protein